MKKITGLLVVLGLMGFAVVSFAQADLDAFPIGTTKMVYTIVTEEMNEPQTLALTVVSRGDGQYTLIMNMEASGTADQLSGFGFLFTGASLSYGGGEDVSYSSLQALINQRSHLRAGGDYILPGGGSFNDIVSVEVAGVQCLEGSFVDPDKKNTRMTMAFSISDPVYTFPLVRVEELRNGEWVETLEMELTEYTFTAPEG
jgi:hypothetical protein